MKRIICLTLSILMLLPLLGCELSKNDESSTVAETIDYKNEPINQWIPYTPPQEIQEDLATLEGEVIEFKMLYERVKIRGNAGVQVVSNIEELNALVPTGEYPEYYLHRDGYNTEFQEQMFAELRKVDFEEYLLLFCFYPYDMGETGFDGSALLNLLEKDGQLVTVFQSKIPYSEEMDSFYSLNALDYQGSIVLVRRSEWCFELSEEWSQRNWKPNISRKRYVFYLCRFINY